MKTLADCKWDIHIYMWEADQGYKCWTWRASSEDSNMTFNLEIICASKRSAQSNANQFAEINSIPKKNWKYI